MNFIHRTYSRSELWAIYTRFGMFSFIVSKPIEDRARLFIPRVSRGVSANQLTPVTPVRKDGQRAS